MTPGLFSGRGERIWMWESGIIRRCREILDPESGWLSSHWATLLVNPVSPSRDAIVKHVTP